MSTHLLKRVLPFLLTLIMGVLIGGLFHHTRSSRYDINRVNFAYSGGSSYEHHCRHGYGNAYDYRTSATITRQPGAVYTAAARRDGINGVVKLRVTLKSDGTVSEIIPVEELPGGLTGEAIKAARRIEFRPAYAYGRPIDSTQYVEYHFDGNAPLSDGLSLGSD